MANKDNRCSQLKIVDLFKKSKNSLTEVLKLQADTQKDVYGYDFKNMTLEELMQYWYMNNHALIDEIHEATDALGGIKDGIGSGVWKKWKASNKLAKSMKLNDLSKDDLKELKMEVVDMFHFFMNSWVSIGGTPKELFNYYMAKNKENRERQKQKY